MSADGRQMAQAFIELLAEDPEAESALTASGSSARSST